MALMQDRVEESLLSAAITSEELAFVATLKPRIFIDGNMWCVLYGENIQDGVAGFGASPILAVYDFNKAWRQELPQSATASTSRGS